MTGRIHAATLAKSDRLKRVHKALRRAGRKGITTWQLQAAAHVCNPATCIAELRANGLDIERTQVGRLHWYRIARAS